MCDLRVSALGTAWQRHFHVTILRAPLHVRARAAAGMAPTPGQQLMGLYAEDCIVLHITVC